MAAKPGVAGQLASQSIPGPFRFNDFSGEIRNEIYQYVVVLDDKFKPSGVPFYGQVASVSAECNAIFSLGLFGPEVKQEAALFFYSHNTFSFDTPSAMHNLMTRLSVPERTAITSLDIAIGVVFRRVGGVRQAVMVESNQLEAAAVACPNLQDLTVHLSTADCRDQPHMLQLFDVAFQNILSRNHVRLIVQLAKCNRYNPSDPSVSRTDPTYLGQHWTWTRKPHKNWSIYREIRLSHWGYTFGIVLKEIGQVPAAPLKRLHVTPRCAARGCKKGIDPYTEDVVGNKTWPVRCPKCSLTPYCSGTCRMADSRRHAIWCCGEPFQNDVEVRSWDGVFTF